MSELFGSLLMASLVAVVASLMVCLFAWTPFRLDVFVWFSVVSMFACWAVIVPAKIAEGRVEDQWPMRFTALILGALVGTLAWGIAEATVTLLPYSSDIGPHPGDSLSVEVFDLSMDQLRVNGGRGDDYRVPLAMCAAYFAFLFAGLQWWKLAECARATRVSLWAIAKCGFVAWLLTFLWWFPQPTGLLIAIVIAFSVQLSSPWLSSRRRREIVQELQQRHYA